MHNGERDGMHGIRGLCPDQGSRLFGGEINENRKGGLDYSGKHNGIHGFVWFNKSASRNDKSLIIFDTNVGRVFADGNWKSF